MDSELFVAKKTSYFSIIMIGPHGQGIRRIEAGRKGLILRVMCRRIL